MKTLINFIKVIIGSVWMRLFAGKGDLSSLLAETALVKPQFLPESNCQKCVEKIEKILSIDQHPRVWRDQIGSDSRILGFEKDIPDLISDFEIERWIKAVDDYTGRKTKSWCLMANKVLPVKDNLGSGGGMHRDSPFSHQVKCIWYLNDVNSQNGCFQYLPGTNNNLIGDRHKFPLGESRFHDLQINMQEVHAEAGALLICDTRCIHGGKPIERGVRYAISLYTFSSVDGIKKLFIKSGLSADHS
ncbi:MAG: phytanoyl-CoA dioxygenase family protein [Neptuniibacter sp.]